MSKLSLKQERFCEEYLIDANATQAAIRAGYSSKTAQEQGARLLVNATLQARIQQLRRVQTDRTGVTADAVVEELAAIAFGSIDGIVEISDGEVSITATDKLTQRQKGTIQSIRKNKDGVSIVFHSKVTALSELAKIFGLVSDFNIALQTVRKYGIDLKLDRKSVV